MSFKRFFYTFLYTIYSILFIILRDISEYPGKVMFSEALFLEGERNSNPKSPTTQNPATSTKLALSSSKLKTSGKSCRVTGHRSFTRVENIFILATSSFVTSCVPCFGSSRTEAGGALTHGVMNATILFSSLSTPMARSFESGTGCRLHHVQLYSPRL